MLVAWLRYPRSSLPPFRRAVVLGVSVGLCVAPVHAAAQQPGFELDWQSPPHCPQRIDITEQIHAMLGAVPGSASSSGLRARGVIEPSEERYRLNLSVRVGQAERSRVIASDDCTSLGKAAAVVLGLLIRREHETGRELSDGDLGRDFPQSATPHGGPNAPEPVKPNERLAPMQTRADPKQKSLRLFVLLPNATLDFWTSPEVSHGLGVGAGVAHGPWRWFASAALWRKQRVTQAGIDAYEATFSRSSFEAWSCRGWRRGSYELSPCALAALDSVGVRASSERLTSEPRRAHIAWVGAGLVGGWRLSERVGLFLSATGRISLQRPEFVAEGLLGSDRAHVIPWGTVQTSVGSEWIF